MGDPARGPGGPGRGALRGPGHGPAAAGHVRARAAEGRQAPAAGPAGRAHVGLRRAPGHRGGHALGGRRFPAQALRPGPVRRGAGAAAGPWPRRRRRTRASPGSSIRPPCAPWTRPWPGRRDTDLPVLFQGEPGTGKGRAARRLHALRHPQAPYLCLSAPSLPPGGPRPAPAGPAPGRQHLRLGPGGAGPERRARSWRGPWKRPLGQGIRWIGGCRDLAALPEPARLGLGVVTFTLPPLRERREDILPMFRALPGRPGAPGRAAGAHAGAGPGEGPAPGCLAREPGPAGLGRGHRLAGHRRTPAGAPAHGPRPGAGEALVLPWPEPGTLAAMLEAVEQLAEGALLRKAVAGRASIRPGRPRHWA